MACLLACPSAEFPAGPVWRVRELSLTGMGLLAPDFSYPLASELLLDIRRGPEMLLAGARVRVERLEPQGAGLSWSRLDQCQETTLNMAIRSMAMDCSVDRHYLIKRFTGKSALLRSLLMIFAEDAPRKLEAIHAALRNEEPEIIAQAAHSLAGVAATVGAPILRELAAALECAARSETGRAPGFIKRLAPLVSALAQEAETVIGILPLVEIA